MPVESTTRNVSSSASTPIEPPDADPVFPCAGDLGEEMAALAVEGARTSHRIEKEIENNEEEIEAQASNAEVDALERKAANVRTSGIVDGCLGFAEAAFQADAAVSGSQGGVGGGTAGAAVKSHVAVDDATVQSLQAAGKISDGFFSAAEVGDDATSKADAEGAQRANAAVRDAQDAAKAQDDVVEKALDFYKTYAQTQASIGLTLAQRV